MSTKSFGGRDEFFSPEYVRIVDDNADAVAAGVKEMLNCPVPPQEIRRCTLEKIEHHKLRLFKLIDTICLAEGLRTDLRPYWSSWSLRALSADVTPNVIRNHIVDAAMKQGISDD